MKINIPEFEKILRKATMNYVMDFIKLEITKEKIKSKLLNTKRDAVVVLDIENKMIPDLKDGDSLDWCWSDPNEKVIPYLQLFDSEEATIKIQNEKINIENGALKTKINFSAPQANKLFTADSPNNKNQPFHTIVVNEDFLGAYNKIKKIATRHQKVYFSIENKKLFIETTDKSNVYENSLKFEIGEVEEDDFNLCFDYKNFTSMMSCLDENEKYRISLYYMKSNKLGMCYLFKKDESEKYFLMSKTEV